MIRVQLPDPRRFAAETELPLMRRAAELAGATVAERPALLSALAGEIASLLENGDEALIRDTLLHPWSAQAARAMWQAIDAAITAASRNGTINLQLFAIPVLIVVGAQHARRIPGVLTDPGAIRTLFEKSGVLGHCRNFGISNALAALDSVEAVSWAKQYRLVKAQDWEGFAGIDLPPADIDVTVSRETVHLRFICGAALTPASAPAFAESAGDIGRWGMQLTKEMGRQLATPDVSLLAIPRAPRSVIRASKEGWFAARELGLQLFLSNALRQARLRFGEPDVIVSAGSDETIRIRLTSQFDELFDQTYGWPLASWDDLDEIMASITGLFEEVRLERIQVVPNVEQLINAQPTSH